MPEMSAAEQDKLSDDQFAFPAQRKEPLVDARHVRNAVARFDQVVGVSDSERGRGVAAHHGGRQQVRCADIGEELA